MKAAILCLVSLILPGVATAGKAIICMDHAEMESALIDWYQAQQAPESPVAGTDYWGVCQHRGMGHCGSTP